MIGFIKGKSAIHLARVYGEKKRNLVGQHFWARGYFVSTVEQDQGVIREYISAAIGDERPLECRMFTCGLQRTSSFRISAPRVDIRRHIECIGISPGR
jgi:Transposase IS200 like